LLLKLQLSGSGNKSKYSGSNLSDETRNRILEQFVTVVVDQEMFRENDLTISQVAEKLGVGRTYLSQVINEHFGLSFNAYINDCRLELAKRYLADRTYDKYSINGIAEMVGFKSLSAFNSGFKKATGLTPSYYRNNS
jgi:AraC-like DNA-binding protein